MGISIKQRYDELKAAHRCPKCTRRLDEGYRFVYCPSCREYNRAAQKKWTPPVSDNAPRHKRRDGALSISQVIRLAAERHVSYGEMVCILEKEGKR